MGWAETDERGVLWTLQAYLFLLILLGGVVIAAGTLPADQSPSTFTDLQHTQLDADVLSTASATGALSDAVLYWNASGERWIGARGGVSPTAYTTIRTHRAHPLWPVLETSLDGRQLGYNLQVTYRTVGDGNGGSSRTQRVVYQGPPGQDAVTVSDRLLLTDDSVPAEAIRSSDGDPCTLGEMGATTTAGTNGCDDVAYFAPDTAPGSGRYNVLKVRLTLWQV